MDGNLNDLSANSFTKSKGAIKDESVNLRLGNWKNYEQITDIRNVWERCFWKTMMWT